MELVKGAAIMAAPLFTDPQGNSPVDLMALILRSRHFPFPLQQDAFPDLELEGKVIDPRL